MRLIPGLLILLLAPSVSATTFYVDSTITDTNVASATPDFTTYNPATFSTSTGSASVFKTVADVNLKAFAVGDSVLFRKGQTWREQLSVPTSGSAGNIITFGNFGSGANPLFDGSNVFASWTTEASIYYASYSTAPNQVFYDGARLTKVALKASVTTGMWWLDTGNTRIYIGSAPAGHTVEFGQRDYGIRQQSKDYITFDGLDASKANIYGIGVSTSTAGNVVIQNCNATYNFEHGISGGGNSVTVQDSFASYNGATGIAMMGGTTNNFLIQRNTTHHNSQLAENANHDYSAGIRVGGSTFGSGSIVDNVSYSQAGGGIQSGQGIWMDTNPTSGSTILISRNLVYDNFEAGIMIEQARGVVVSYNVSYGHTAVDGCGFLVTRNTNGNRIYNNTAYNNLIGFCNYGGTGVPTSSVNNEFRNNIAFSNTQALEAKWGGDNTSSEGSGNIFSNNAFGAQSTNFIEWGSNAFKSTYAAWETSYGGTTSSVQTNPLLTNPGAGDFTLQATSPAINVGANLGSTYQTALLTGSTWPGGVLTGNQNSYGAGWEIGAYIYGGGSPAPTVTSIAPTSGTTAGGTALTDIAGTGFVSGATVTLGGSSATSVVWVSSIKLTAVSPAHAAGAVNVVVTNPDAQSGTLTNGYTYTAPASPRASSIGKTQTQGTVVIK